MKQEITPLLTAPVYAIVKQREQSNSLYIAALSKTAWNLLQSASSTVQDALSHKARVVSRHFSPPGRILYKRTGLIKWRDSALRNVEKVYPIKITTMLQKPTYPVDLLHWGDNKEQDWLSIQRINFRRGGRQAPLKIRRTSSKTRRGTRSVPSRRNEFAAH